MDASTFCLAPLTPGVPRLWGLLLTKSAFAIFWSCCDRCWSHKSLLFSRMSADFAQEWFTAMLPSTSSHTFHCFMFSSFSASCRGEGREWRKISSHYFSILCCPNNIQGNKPGGKSLIEQAGFLLFGYTFWHFYSLKELKIKLEPVK